MGSSNSIIRPQELADFRKLNTSYENLEIPARPESRSLTDKKGFIIYGVAILILLPFLIYALAKTPDNTLDNFDSLDRVLSSQSDDLDNIFNKRFNKRATQFTYGNNRYRNDHSDQQFETWIKESGEEWWKYLLTVIITIALSILTLVALRYAPAPVVWGVVILSIVLLVIMTAGLWFIYFATAGDEEYQGASQQILPFTIAWTIVACVIFIVFIVLFKRIGLVVQLYKEATKVLAAMPMLVFVPVLTTLVQFIVLAIAIVTNTIMIANEGSRYRTSGLTVFTVIINALVAIWTLRFIHGLQYMIISGSVSTWYFAKNKDYLDSPICTNFKITLKYHVGTVFFGSFILTLFSVVKAILRSICRNACCRCIFVMCCSSVEVVLHFLSENAYIQTGIHGQSFLRSAKRATKLLLSNAESVIAINCVGDFVLGIVILFVTLIATAISYAMFMNMGYTPAIAPTLICFFVNLFIVCFTFGTFQTIIDTLFICFCEDSVLNDGMSRPYYMSKGLMEFVENSKKVYGKENR